MSGKRKILVAAMLLSLSLGVAPMRSDSEELSVDEIIRRWIEKQASKSELVFVRMHRRVPARDVQEHRLLAVYRSRDGGGQDYFFRLVAPADVEGVTVLVHDDGKGEARQFLHLPSIGKMRRLTTDARRQPFLNSDFTYEDLQREIPALQSYQRLPDAKIRGIESYRVRAFDKNKDAGGAYSHRDLFIDKSSFRMHQVDFFDRDGKLVKVMQADEYDSPHITGATKRPRRLTMANLATGSSTEFLVVESKLDEPMDPALFTPEKLEKWTLAEIEDFVFTTGITVKLR
jgi:hypothetical protein